jgi:hypothetical protein
VVRERSSPAALVRRWAGVGAAACAITLVAMSPEPARAEDPPAPLSRASVTDVYEGAPVETCGFPSVVAVTSGSSLCTGTLIHPEVVVYAAHCGGGAKLVRFADALQGGVAVPVAACVTNPAYEPGLQGEDYAYCKLSAPMAFPITPPATGCVLDRIDEGADVALVGFGEHTVDAAGEGAGAGTKRHAPSTVAWIDRANNEIGIDGYCQGDSGGPALWSDGAGWWALSVVSTGKGCEGAGANGTNALLAGAIPWIEAQTGVDLTPCQDLAGRWAPTGACGAFFAGDERAGGAWSSSCEGAARSGAAATCGSSLDLAADREAPWLRIAAPGRITAVAEAPLVVDILVEARDDHAGVAWVGIEVDGALLGVRDTLAPYEFRGATFPAGAFVVRAVAEDYAGRRSVSEPIGLGVVDPPPSLPGLDDGCNATGGDGPWGRAGLLAIVCAGAYLRRRSRPREVGAPARRCVEMTH